MAIDLTTEHVISIHEAARRVPPYREDLPTHPSRIIRAIQRGELEGLRFGTQWCTSVEALQRWGERQSTGKTGAAPSSAPDAPRAARSPSERRKDVTKARRDLAKMGVAVE